VLLSPDAGTSFYRLKVENLQPAPASVTIWTIDRPSVGSRYAVTGEVRYDRIEGIGYLELWNHFPDGSQYFSRTLGDGGAMQKLTGSSGWRTFTLPFDATGAASAPSRLVLNVVLPGRGRVELGPLKLVTQEIRSHGSVFTWSDRVGGLTGGIAGALVGSIGALVGVLASIGRARRLVMALLAGLIALGATSLVGGVAALASAQPYSVFYPLLLIGVVSCTVPLGLLPSIRRRYAEIELRMMRAHDIG